MGLVLHSDWYNAIKSFPELNSIMDIRRINASRQEAMDVDKAVAIYSEVDIVASFNYNGYLLTWLNIPDPKPLSMLITSDSFMTIQLWNNKVKWIKWMEEIGFANYIPKTYTEDNLLFPCLIKTSRHSSAGVTAIYNKEDLKYVTAELERKETAFTIQEALTGMGNREGG